MPTSFSYYSTTATCNFRLFCFDQWNSGVWNNRTIFKGNELYEHDPERILRTTYINIGKFNYTSKQTNTNIKKKRKEEKTN